MMRQIGLLPAGCQPWNSNMLDGTRSKFAYCSTMAVYIYEASSPFQEYKLTSINAEHTKTITSIAWNMKHTNLIATSGADLKILVWDVSKQKVIAQLLNLKAVTSCIDWMLTVVESPTLTYLGASGYLESWNIATGKVSTLKNINCVGQSNVTTFKWHHTRQHTIAFGYLDGSVMQFVKDGTSAKKKTIRFTDDTSSDDRVVLLSWDPLSNDYLLIANKRSGLRLVDTSSGDLITTFCLPSRAITTTTFSWINSAPGMFLTGDRETGVLRLWTVGQEQPLENFRVKYMGFNGVHVLDRPQGNHYDENLARGSSRRKPSHSQTPSHSVPPANVVCTFRDGGVGLYDLQRKRWLFLKDQGHIETIFDCKFKPDNPKLLATASFDGTIKIWSTTDLSPVKTSSGNEGVIYSISWAPESLNCIACSTRRNGVFVWDFNKERVIKRFSEHGSFAVFCVSWNQRDSHRIASGSEDCYCIVQRLDGKERQKLSHPAAVYGCEWSLLDKTALATGCEDTTVRIWNVVDKSAKCVKELRGHTKKVFHVRWHPLIKDILCSGSDDCTIRIWNITLSSNCCVGILTGHDNKVRGLSWNYEIPHLLVSGSWDSTIRLWDARETKEKCLGVIDDHGADVYGLTSHPSTPFTMASTSRDSTVRLWTLAPTLSLLFAKVLVGHPLDTIICKPEEGMEVQSALRLAGKMSKQITDELIGRPKSLVVKYRWFSELFSATPSLENLWDVACFTLGAKETSLSPEYKTGILHVSHLVKYKSADAQEMELASASKLQGGNRQIESTLERAAAVHLKLGNLRKHCEILKLLGRWETALSRAPAVSVDYWKQLTNEYSEVLEESGDTEYLPYRIAIGDTKKCIQDLSKAGDYEDALLIVQSALEGRMPSQVPDVQKSLSNGNMMNGNSRNDDYVQLENFRKECTDSLSQVKYTDGDPYCAATYQLSSNNKNAALKALIQANELLLVLCIGKALKCDGEILGEAAELLGRKLEGEKNFLFAIEVLRSFAENAGTTNQDWGRLHSSCARYDGSPEQRDNLHKFAGLPPPTICLEKALQCQQSGNMKQAMQYFLLSTQQDKGLEIGLDLIFHEMNQNPRWTISDLTQFESLLSVSSSILTEPNTVGHKNRLLAISAYLAALKAINHQYFPIVTPLLEHAIAMTERQEMVTDSTTAFPLSSAELKQHLSAWKSFDSHSNSPGSIGTEERYQDECTQLLMRRAGQGTNFHKWESNNTVVAGSKLPSHSDVHVSSLTNKRIIGPKFCLEDGITIISLNEAIMWARVNQFSPTGSGKRIVPF